MIDSILILVIVILPGGLSVTVNRLYNPSVSDKSLLMEWSMLLYHATVAHIVCIALMTIGLSIWHSFADVALVVEQFLIDGLVSTQLDMSWHQFAVYIVLLVIVSVLSGIYDFPSFVTYGLAKLSRRGQGERKPLYEKSTWYHALDDGLKSSDKRNVQVRVRLKTGETYIGDLKRYPVLPDSEGTKDFWINGTVLFWSPPQKDPIELRFGKTGAVLLNTSNVVSMEFQYHDDYKVEQE